ncbi:MAG: hypothetical protein ACK5QW_04180 [Cyanobacteriota bacterium]
MAATSLALLTGGGALIGFLLSVIGFLLSVLGAGGSILPLLVSGAVGALVGQALAPHLSERRLRQGFALLLVGSALLTGGEALRLRPAVGTDGGDGVPGTPTAATVAPKSE